MAINRRQILAAIDAETAERSGPMPAWLVAIAVNAKTPAARNGVDAELIALRQARLIDCRGNQAQGSGLVLTEAGRQALRELNRGKGTPPPAPRRAAEAPTRHTPLAHADTAPPGAATPDVSTVDPTPADDTCGGFEVRA